MYRIVTSFFQRHRVPFSLDVHTRAKYLRARVMATVVAKTLMTAEELWQLPDDGYRYELVAGELRQMPPSGFLHGTVAMNCGSLLREHVRKYDLGVVCAAETGFKLRQIPDTVRTPDAAFVTKERVLAQGGTEKF